ncbi:MAG: oligoendopeptidase F [Ignavibacteriaceae bacterium]
MKKIILTISILALFISNHLFAQYKEREEIPDKYKWNLSDIYKSVEEWGAAKQWVIGQLDKIESFKGRLSESSNVLLDAMTTYFNCMKELYKVFDYANRLRDQDLRISENQLLTQEAANVGTAFSEKTSYIRPEILKIDPEKINSFFEEEPALKEYDMFINDILRMKEHTLSEPEEKILASFGLVTGTPGEVYGIFNNAEMPYAEITLSTGETINLSPAAFTKYRSTSVREDREKIFEAFFSKYGDFQNTIGANLYGKVKTDFVYAKNRNYPSAIAYSLDGPNIPVSVYKNLTEQIHKSLPTLHRFLEIKKKLLGVEELHYYDLYTPLADKVDMHFTVEEGQQILLNALNPLGDEYISTLRSAFNDRWIDYLPSPGKRSGAYSSGASYDIHPYILMNWNDDYESVSTLAHELGHTMHSYFSNKQQPFAKADYATFVAEIASTFNENLLNNFMVKNSKSNEEKLYLLGSYLDLLRTTIFRQTLFAEFEWEIHKKAEENLPLTGEDMSRIYLDLVKEYYGQEKGMCIVDPYIQYEWAYIPHFINYTYYVYQYSTSLIYATAFAEKVRSGEEGAVDNFFRILKGGGSDYPVELIKQAGIDPLSPEAFELTMKRMNDVMDEIERLMKQ